ncbi:hypothetical protein H2199_007144 [Coniosporium tulheliwenetii]|uniref:Uncharacterized protein n=1 Tax=Coniosporium tulheliwenetii TaxID=3383036 RepID=A0ACC2YR81_9PEZI|nr:hypothetical protein H2199_007144 [Cladosporium sp. JES 115]
MHPFKPVELAVYKYTPIDLEGPAFRLIRLLRGRSTDGIQCELFEAWLHEAGGVIPYEALSYTWGNMGITAEITINNCIMGITENLHLALQHLRYEYADRILWVDAICIDQGNLQERGHQIKQMTNIYKEAEQVVIWLGPATDETDLIIDSTKRLQEAIVKVEGDWRRSAELWMDAGLVLRPTLSRGSHAEWNDQWHAQRMGLEALLKRPWFRRIWVLQEVANARVAVVVCGKKSVSARIFALVPSILKVQPDRHCQAVLDIMPGLSRKESWWSQKRDLRTLLVKFSESEATDPRDMADSKDDDYGRTPLSWAVIGGQEAVVKLLVVCDDVNVNSKDKSGRTPLLWAAERGHKAVVRLLLKNGAAVDTKDKYGQTPLSEAAKNGHEANNYDRTPLFWAAMGGHEAVVKLLLDRDDVNADSKDDHSRTPLSLAAEGGHEAVVKLLLARDDVNADSKDMDGRTPLSWAAVMGRETVVKLLLARDDVNADLKDMDDDINADSKDMDGRTPLLWAAEEGHEAVVRLLLTRDDVDADSKDSHGVAPLLRAIVKGHEVVVRLLLARNDVDAGSQNGFGLTPLSMAVRIGHEAIVRLLLARDDVDADADLKDEKGSDAALVQCSQSSDSKSEDNHQALDAV